MKSRRQRLESFAFAFAFAELKLSLVHYFIFVSKYCLNLLPIDIPLTGRFAAQRVKPLKLYEVTKKSEAEGTLHLSYCDPDCVPLTCE